MFSVRAHEIKLLGAPRRAVVSEAARKGQEEEGRVGRAEQCHHSPRGHVAAPSLEGASETVSETKCGADSVLAICLDSSPSWSGAGSRCSCLLGGSAMGVGMLMLTSPSLPRPSQRRHVTPGQEAQALPTSARTAPTLRQPEAQTCFLPGTVHVEGLSRLHQCADT